MNKYACENCKNYRKSDGTCRVDKRKHPRGSCCGNWKVIMADHRVESPWEAWKKQKEMELLRQKGK